MKIRLTFDLTERDRLAVARRYGSTEPVSRQDMATFIEGIVNGELDSLHRDLDEAERNGGQQ